MKINTKEDYLEYRIRVLSSELSENMRQYEHNQIQIDELNNKIGELQSEVDEGFKMFSPIAATDMNFNQQEVKNLKMKIYLFADENNEINQKIDSIKKELKVLKILYERKDESVVTNNDKIKEKISDKIRNCIDFCDSDIHRVKLELQKLLSEIESI